jgi:hypothetical protein
MPLLFSTNHGSAAYEPSKSVKINRNKTQSSSSTRFTAAQPTLSTPTPSASSSRNQRLPIGNLLSSCQIYSTAHSASITASINSKTSTSVLSTSSTTKVKRTSSLRSVTSPTSQQQQQSQSQATTSQQSPVKRSSSITQKYQKSKLIADEPPPLSQQLNESYSNEDVQNSQEQTMILSMAPLSSANLSQQNQLQLIDISSVMSNISQYENQIECKCYLCEAYTNDKRNSLVNNYEIIPNDYRGNHRYMKYSYGKPYSQLSCMKLFNLINTDCTIYYDESITSQSNEQQYYSFDQQATPQQNFTSITTTSNKYFCHVHNNRSPIYDCRYMYIIDCRIDRKKYEHSHINTSIHYSDLLNDDIYLSPPLENYTIIVLYDDDGTYLTSSDMPLQSQTQQRRTPHTNFRRILERQESSDLLITKIKEKLHNYNGVIYLISGGYDQFSATYPFMCSSSDIRSTVDRYKHLIIYPNCVLENQIFIGTGVQAKNWKIIRDLNITHIVNCSIEHECIFSDALKYLHCRLEDSLEENIYRDLEKACRFIDNALNYGSDNNNSDSDDQNDSRSRNGSGSNQQAKILIHCNLGISRSSSILIAYLIRRYRLCLYSAFNYVKDKRIQTAPNQSFLKQLKHFEDKNVH